MLRGFLILLRLHEAMFDYFDRNLDGSIFLVLDQELPSEMHG